MTYTRPKNSSVLTKAEKVILLKEYFVHYEQALRSRGIEALNTKISREIFSPVLEEIGETLLLRADQLLNESADVQSFLESTPLPPHMVGLLPDNFRVFSLLLNALKQWVTAESAAMDRFLLGGTARTSCREAATHCIVTGEEFGAGAELHHPVRDGRPPILLSKRGHDIVERSSADSASLTDESTLTENQRKLWQKMQSIRSKRNQSWVQLREGCIALLNPESPCRRVGAKSFAKNVSKETGGSPQEIVEILDFMSK